jgi:hypothetical protein
MLPFGVVLCGDVADRTDPGVVDQDVQPVELAERRPDRGVIGDVGDEPATPVGRSGGIAVERRDLGSTSEEQCSRRLSDA